MIKSDSKGTNQGIDVQDSSGPESSSAKPFSERIERLLSDILGMFPRFVWTLFIFAIKPLHASMKLLKEPMDYSRLVRPNTFLLFGCLFFSVFLSALELSKFTESLSFKEIPEAISAGIHQLLNDGPSLFKLILKTLPILVVTSFSAVLAGQSFKSAKMKVKTFFIYLYGLQGSIILLFALTIEMQGEILLKLFGGDDLILLIMLVFIIGLAFQSARIFRGLIHDWNPKKKIVKLLIYLAFVVFFLVPLPLAGFLVVELQQSRDQMSKENQEPSLGRPIRIIEVTALKIDGNQMNIEVTAIVENRSDQTITLRPSDTKLDIYFVARNELGRISNSGLGPSNVYNTIDYFDRYYVHLELAQIAIEGERWDIWTLAPKTDRLIKVSANQDISSIKFHSNERGLWRYKDEDFNTRQKLLREREEPLRNKLAQVSGVDKLAYVSDNREIIVQLNLKDRTQNVILTSDFYRLEAD